MLSQRASLAIQVTTWLATASVLATSAGADERLSLEKIRDAVCANADAKGETLRPYVCDPRCDCLESSAIASATGCTETAPGTFSAPTVTDLGPCGDICVEGAICGSSSLSGCSVSSECATGEVCLYVPFFGTDVCFLPCSTNADCPGTELCEGSPLGSCVVDGDCPISGSCSSANTCDPLVCSQDADCQLPASTLSLTGVAGPDSPDPVTCSDIQAATSELVNSNDALECIAQIETAIGQACTPFPP